MPEPDVSGLCGKREAPLEIRVLVAGKEEVKKLRSRHDLCPETTVLLLSDEMRRVSSSGFSLFSMFL